MARLREELQLERNVTKILLFIFIKLMIKSDDNLYNNTMERTNIEPMLHHLQWRPNFTF